MKNRGKNLKKKSLKIKKILINSPNCPTYSKIHQYDYLRSIRIPIRLSRMTTTQSTGKSTTVSPSRQNPVQFTSV